MKLFIPYHDEEWGIDVHDDRLLSEMLNLEGAQASPLGGSLSPWQQSTCYLKLRSLVMNQIS